MKLANNFFFYLLCLLPLIFITGPFLTDLSLSLIGIYFIVNRCIQKDFSFLRNKIFILLASFYFWLIITGFFSKNYINSLFSNEAVIFYFRYFFFIFGVALLLEQNICRLKIVFIYLVAVFFLVLFDSYFQFFNGTNIFGYEKYDLNRVTSFFKDETILGQYLAKIFPIIIVLYLMLYNYDHKSFYFYLVSATIVLLIIFISGERLSFALISLFMISLAVYEHQKLKIYIFYFIFLLFTLFILYQNIDFIEFRVNQTFNQISQTYISYLPYTPDHEKHYLSAIKMFLHKPILGVGPAMFEYSCSKLIYFVREGCASHPHNYYVQLLAETGIIGFLFLFTIFVSLIREVLTILFYKKYTIDNLKRYVVYITIIFLILPIVPHNDFYNNHLNFLLFYPVGYFLFLLNQKELRTKNII